MPSEVVPSIIQPNCSFRISTEDGNRLTEAILAVRKDEWLGINTTAVYCPTTFDESIPGIFVAIKETRHTGGESKLWHQLNPLNQYQVYLLQ